MHLRFALLTASLAGSLSLVACSGPTEEATDESSSDLSIDPARAARAAGMCKWKKRALRMTNPVDGDVSDWKGSFEVCLDDGARIACDKDGTVIPGSLRECQCTDGLAVALALPKNAPVAERAAVIEQNQSRFPTVQCKPQAAVTKADCESLRIGDVRSTSQSWEEGDVYRTRLQLSLDNPTEKVLPTKVTYRHRFPNPIIPASHRDTSDPRRLADQTQPHNVGKASTTYTYDVLYTEETFGPQFGVNDGELEIACQYAGGVVTTRRAFAFTRTRDAADE